MSVEPAGHVGGSEVSSCCPVEARFMWTLRALRQFSDDLPQPQPSRAREYPGAGAVLPITVGICSFFWLLLLQMTVAPVSARCR